MKNFDNFINSNGHYKTMNETDENENPSGGYVEGQGISIRWQDGPLGEMVFDGAFVEDVIFAACQRLSFYQTSKFKCDENQQAIDGLVSAMAALSKRTQNRKDRGVEGTHQI